MDLNLVLKKELLFVSHLLIMGEGGTHGDGESTS